MPPPDDPGHSLLHHRAALACGREWFFFWCVVSLAFFALRLPVMYHQPGGEDEDCYAVPGLTILKTGLPQLPHVPARNGESVYYHADRILYAEPPLTFYLQALFYLVLPHVYGTARLLSAVAGIGLLAFLALLARRWTGNPKVAYWAVGLFSLSRWFYFPATRARPDVLTALLGLAALWTVCLWQGTKRTRLLVLTGVLIGLGGLTHPFAIVYAIQIAAWLALTSRGWQRLTHPALVASASLATAALWVPLILLAPEIFRVQFWNQFFTGGEDTLVQRLLFPGKSLAYHGLFMWNHIGAWQFLLALVPLVVCSFVSWRQCLPGLGTLCLLAWSAIYLLSAFVGSHHPTLGYWVYAASLMFICTGWFIEAAISRLLRLWGGAGSMLAPSRRAWLTTLAGIALGVSMMVGSGVRTLVVHLRHWNDVDYNAPAFARRLMSEIPAAAVCTVDTQFALDFVAAGRPTLLAQTMPMYFRADQFSYDYLIISRYGLETGLAERMCCRFEREAGRQDDIFACYAAIYRPTKSPCHPPEGEQQ